MNHNIEKVNIYIGYAAKMAIVIRGLRNMFAMSQEQLAQEAGSSRPTINRLESMKGDKGCKADTIDKLLDVFRRKGVEITIREDGIIIALPKVVLLEAQRTIPESTMRNPANMFNSTTIESSKPSGIKVKTVRKPSKQSRIKKVSDDEGRP